MPFRMVNSFKQNLKEFLGKPILYLPVFLACFLNLLLWLFLIIRIQPSAAWIPLHYNVNFGIDFLGPWLYIFLFPLAGFALIVLDLILGLSFQVKEVLLTRLLVWSAVIVQLFIILSLFFLALNSF